MGRGGPPRDEYYDEDGQYGEGYPAEEGVGEEFYPEEDYSYREAGQEEYYPPPREERPPPPPQSGMRGRGGQRRPAAMMEGPPRGRGPARDLEGPPPRERDGRPQGPYGDRPTARPVRGGPAPELDDYGYPGEPRTQGPSGPPPRRPVPPPRSQAANGRGYYDSPYDEPGEVAGRYRGSPATDPDRDMYKPRPAAPEDTYGDYPPRVSGAPRSGRPSRWGPPTHPEEEAEYKPEASGPVRALREERFGEEPGVPVRRPPMGAGANTPARPRPLAGQSEGYMFESTPARRPAPSARYEEDYPLPTSSSAESFTRPAPPRSGSRPDSDLFRDDAYGEYSRGADSDVYVSYPIKKPEEKRISEAYGHKRPLGPGYSDGGDLPRGPGAPPPRRTFEEYAERREQASPPPKRERLDRSGLDRSGYVSYPRSEGVYRDF